jgi:UDP:flavonoid glycosyltransferase YjiC (YdhE family)
LPFERVRPDRPLVYVTLGTVFNTAVDLLRTLVTGVAALDVEVLVTTRADGRPRDARAAVVYHAGVGTVYGALSVGVPLVVAPLAADQPICAMGCVLQVPPRLWRPSPDRRSSWPYAIDATAVTTTQASEATTRVLESSTYRGAAQRIAAEIAAAPPPSSMRPWLTSLAGHT